MANCSLNHPEIAWQRAKRRQNAARTSLFILRCSPPKWLTQRYILIALPKVRKGLILNGYRPFLVEAREQLHANQNRSTPFHGALWRVGLIKGPAPFYS